MQSRINPTKKMMRLITNNTVTSNFHFGHKRVIDTNSTDRRTLSVNLKIMSETRHMHWPDGP